MAPYLGITITNLKFLLLIILNYNFKYSQSAGLDFFKRRKNKYKFYQLIKL